MSRLSELEQEQVARIASVTRVIVLALIAGVSIFCLIVVFVIRQGQEPGPPGAITIVCAVIAIGLAVASFVMGTSSTQGSTATGESSRVTNLAARYQTGRIIAGALLEGGAFMNIVAYMLEGSWISLVVVGVLMLLLIRLIPTRESAIQWVEWQLEEQRIAR